MMLLVTPSSGAMALKASKSALQIQLRCMAGTNLAETQQ